MSPGRYADKVALVTGASRGIGLAIAERLVSEGAKVCITARRREQLDEAAARLGGREVAIAVAGAADDADHRAGAVTATVEAFGPLDLLVNNTGINPLFGSLAEADPASLRRIVDVNLIASLDWVRIAHETGGLGSSDGAVVNVASVAGLRPAGGIGFYGASKAALMHLTQQLAVELAPRTRVNAVAPAVVRTKFAGPLYEGQEEEVTSRYPLGRLGEARDVASAVAFLGSVDASWVTGHVLTVDGGLTLGGGI